MLSVVQEPKSSPTAWTSSSLFSRSLFEKADRAQDGSQESPMGLDDDGSSSSPESSDSAETDGFALSLSMVQASAGRPPLASSGKSNRSKRSKRNPSTPTPSSSGGKSGVKRGRSIKKPKRGKGHKDG